MGMLLLHKGSSELEIEKLFLSYPKTASAIPPPHPPPELISGSQSGVKKGRINKRPIVRRKKSIVLEEVAEAIRTEATRHKSTKPESPNGGNLTVGSRVPCTKPGWQAFDVLIGPTSTQPNANFLKRLVQRDDLPAHPNHPCGPTVLEVNGYWPTRVPDSPLVSPTIGGLDHLSLSQNGGSTFPVSPTTAGLHETYGRVQNSESSSAFIDPFQKPQNFYSTSALSSIPQQSVALFSTTPIDQHTGLVGNKVNGHTKNHISSPTAISGGVEEHVAAVKLSPSEWDLIQQIRATGINIAELAKIVCNRQVEMASTLGTDDNASMSSNATSPYTNLDSAHSSPPAVIGGGGCCSRNTQSPRNPSSPINKFPSASGGSCCTTGSGTKQLESTDPGSPRCKCGEACLCVPCADHPHNPAMLAHIRENMELMESPQQQMFDVPHLGGGWYEDEAAGDTGELGDFGDFVFCDYQYGSAARCSEGTGRKRGLRFM
ncbi:hypothetical protein BDD12DRAFT_808350 [Trichophaea hybrida]|nr:hypothetical protein BDD12DRAFT_808350 [Trichophaea hybrida]